jgi:hypothetical protein
MDKICLIRQPSGLGDIIFSLKIANHFKKLGYEILWPIISEFNWITDYIEGYNFYNKGDSNYQTSLLPNDKFRDVYNTSQPIFTENFIYLPLQFATQIVSNYKIMESKYRMVNLDYSDWCQYFNIKRNKDKENELYYNILKLTDDDDYVLVSKNYGSPPNYLKWDINVDTNKKIINLDFIDGYNLFDWCKVIENATEIYTIDSAIILIIEKIINNDKPIYLFSRYSSQISEVDYFLNKNFILC